MKGITILKFAVIASWATFIVRRVVLKTAISYTDLITFFAAVILMAIVIIPELRKQRDATRKRFRDIQPGRIDPK